MSNLAILMQASSRFAEAEMLFNQALAILKDAVGARHYLTAFTRSNFADFLLLAGRKSEAAVLAAEALRDLRASLPEAHRYTCWAREVIARAS
jgi:hypothetical protein